MGTKKTTRKRKRRTPEEMIADLQAEIGRVKRRAKAKELSKFPVMKKLLAAVRAIDQAIELAGKEKNREAAFALADARKPLAAYLESAGVSVPKPRMPRGPRPRKAE